VIYQISHTTRYDYESEVEASYAEVYQLPIDIDGQRCRQRSVTTEPRAGHHHERSDYFGNRAAVLTIHEPHTTLVVTSTSVVDTSGRPEAFGESARRGWESYRVAAEAPHDLTAVEFSLDSPLVSRSERLARYAADSFTSNASLEAALGELNRRIHSDFAFDPEATDIDTPLETVLDLRRGVCQDLAHVMIGCLRSVGLAACYVSGYLETDPPPGSERLVGADRTHAWVGAYLGDGEWIGIDPTNAQLAGHRYVTTARGRDYSDVPPLKGVIFTDAEESTLTVSVDVTPMDHATPIDDATPVDGEASTG
jgi:transglutaminase-like putative cysteine protease